MNFAPKWLLPSLALGIWAATAPGCSTSSNSGSGTPQDSGTGVCADSCLKSCAADAECNTADGELCCDLGDGSACLKAKDCPRFCTGDKDCDTAKGDACLRVTLAAPQSVCTDPGNALKLCKSDGNCGQDEVCCSIYKEPACVKADRCPQACSKSKDCDTSAGEVCCTTLSIQDTTLGVDGLCIDPNTTTCPTACSKSSDCDTKHGELCCNGLCATSCVKSCTASADCDGQICCRAAAEQSPWAHDVTTPGYDVPVKGNAGSGAGGSANAGGSGNTGGNSNTAGSGTGGTAGSCETCSQAMAAADLLGTNVCKGTSATLFGALGACICVANCTADCAGFCTTGARSQACDTCIATSCGSQYTACLGD